MHASQLLKRTLAELPRTSETCSPLRLVAVPGDGVPRWLLPEDSGGLDAVLANWSPYRPASRFKWSVLRGANRLGILKSLPNVAIHQFPDAAAIDWRALGWNDAAPPAMLVYVGTPGPTQKAVLHLVSPAFRTCDAIVKVPLARDAKYAILREATTLADLADEQYDRAPHLLHFSRERGISTQQFLRGRPGSRRFLPEYYELLRSLRLPDGDTSLAAHAARWQPALAAVTPEGHCELLISALAELDDPKPLPACWVHGDFAPWNIRHRPNLPPALIDWEDAQRGGLPMQDAYHFLHIQDFLFAGKPALHARDLLPFGQDLGLTRSQCERLEIAYLTHSYLQCSLRADPRRADFLSRSLAQALQSCHPRPMPSAAANVADVRAALFRAVVARLNQEGIPYCVLSGYEEPQEGAPDVDIMVRRQDQPRMPHLLQRVAQSAGAMLAQSIQHETTATYFILARPHGNQIGYLDVDCYSDYRKDARTWLPAEEVIAGRRKYRDFYLPAIADEFAYYLIKKVIKQSIAAHHLQRLHHLFTNDAEECRRRLARFWPAKALPLEQAIAGKDLAQLRQQLPALQRELQKADAVESFLRRCAGKLQEIARRLRRGMHPTGLWVEIAGDSTPLPAPLADELVLRLAPAFRCAGKQPPSDAAGRTLAGKFEAFAARLWSTLSVSIAAELPTVADVRQTLWRWACELIGRIVRPDLLLVIGPREDANLVDKVVHLDASGDPEAVIQSACQLVLQHLASRLEKRLGREPSLQALCRREKHEIAAKPAELRPVGSD